MIFNLFRKSTTPDAADEAYRIIVAQSRQPRFYADWGVPDTVTGRFNVLALHMGLWLHRLNHETVATEFTQALVDCFFSDMDASHRELGVTDLGVPTKIRRLGDIFYGLVKVLGEALDEGHPPAVAAVLARNVYAGAMPPAATAFADYLLEEAARLGAEPAESFIGARLTA